MSRTARRWAGWLIAVGAGLSGSLAPSSPVVTTEAWLATGDVVMIASQLECRPEIQVLLLLDEEGPDAEQNGLVNHLFRLQAEPGDVTDEWVRVLQDAEVRWGPEHVEVWKNGSAAWILSIQDIPGTTSAERFQGFGLSHTTNLQGVAMPEPDVANPAQLTPEDLFLNDLMNQPCQAYACLGGGPGATSCGISCEPDGDSCNVSCADGFDPCCGCDGVIPCCSCVGEGPPGG